MVFQLFTQNSAQAFMFENGILGNLEPLFNADKISALIPKIINMVHIKFVFVGLVGPHKLWVFFCFVTVWPFIGCAWKHPLAKGKPKIGQRKIEAEVPVWCMINSYEFHPALPTVITTYE